MNKFLVLVVMLVLLAGGGYWLYLSKVKNIPEIKIPELESTLSEKNDEVSGKNLFDLKNSIQGVIEDSVQDDIQEAVEKEMKKSKTE